MQLDRHVYTRAARPGVVLCLVLLTTAALAASRSGAELEAEASRVRWERLQSLISVVRQAVGQPGPVGETLRTALKDRAEILFNQQRPTPASVYQARLTVASLFKDKNTRDLLVSAATSEVQRLSSQMKRQALAAQTPLIVDEIVIGMGPQGTAYAQEKTSSDPDRLVLMIDRARKPGGTFSEVGGAFRLNSTNRQDNGSRATPGQGDLNKLHDIVGLPDFKGARWVEAGSLGEVATVGVALSSALPMLETEIVKVERNPFEGPRYQVELRDLRSGRTFYVKTDKVAVATGLGRPTFSFADAPTRETIERERSSAERARVTPKIESFTEFINRVGDPENRKPIRDLLGKNVLVVGGGDSGRVVNELLVRLGSEEAYRDDVAQAGQVKRIFWYVGKSGFAECKEYISKARARYAQLAQALNSGQLVPVPGNVNRIATDGQGRYVIDTDTLIGPTPGAGGKTSMLKTGGEVVYYRVADVRTGQTQQLVTEAVSFDKVISATGFESELPRILAPLYAGDFKAAWKPLERVAEAFGESPVIVANELRDALGVFAIGPANEILGGLPRKEELKGINENTVSLFANVERSRALARFLADSPETAYRTVMKPVLDAVYGTSLATTAVELLANGPVSSISIQVNREIFQDTRRVAAAELALRVGLDASLRGLRVSGTKDLVLRVRKVAKGAVPGSGDYSVEFAGSLVNGANAIREAFATNALLNSVLLRDYFDPATGIVAIDIRVPVRKSGELDLVRMEVTSARR